MENRKTRGCLGSKTEGKIEKKIENNRKNTRKERLPRVKKWQGEETQ